MTEEEYEQAGEALWQEYDQDRARIEADGERIGAEYLAACKTLKDWFDTAYDALFAEYRQKLIPVGDAYHVARDANQAELNAARARYLEQKRALAEKYGGAA